MSARDHHLLPFCAAFVIGIGSAQSQNLDAGKSGSQLFASDCSSCHRSPRGLAKDRFSWSLTSFLTEHYTANPASARELTSYLLSFGNNSQRANQSLREGKSALTITSKSITAQGEPLLRPPANVPNQ
jgi:mono/diheme cytochrome c family protein